MQVGGIVLCGGASRRMGRPKAWLPFGGETMLQRIGRILREVVEPIVVVAAPEQELPALAGDVQVVHDAEEYRGPLQGLATGLTALNGRVEAVYLSSCDVPFLLPNFVRRMIHLLGPHQIVVPEVAGFQHPLAAVYRVDVLPAVEELLAADRLRPVFLFDRCRTRIVRFDELADVDPDCRSLRNLNTPEEYETALKNTFGSTPSANQ